MKCVSVSRVKPVTSGLLNRLLHPETRTNLCFTQMELLIFQTMIQTATLGYRLAVGCTIISSKRERRESKHPYKREARETT